MVVRRNTAGTQALKAKLDAIGRKQLQVGWFETARYADGTPVAYVAMKQEFGDGRIPPRPFMRPAQAQNRDQWLESLQGGLRAYLNDNATLDQALLATGFEAAADIAQAIKDVTSPELAKSTIAARRAKKKTGSVSEKPLIDTAQMFQSVTAEVYNK